MAKANPLSFLPEDYLAGKRRRRTITLCAMLFLAVVGGMAATLYMAERSLGVARAEASDIEVHYAEAARRIRQVEQMQDKQRRMARQAELTASLLEKVPRSFVLAEVTNALPTGASLLDFSLDSRVRVPVEPPKTAFDKKKADAKTKPAGPPPPPEPRQFDVTIKVTGVAQTDIQVAHFISQLGQSPLFRDVNLIVSEEFTRDKDRIRRFQLEMTLNNSAEIAPDVLHRNNQVSARVRKALFLGSTDLRSAGQ